MIYSIFKLTYQEPAMVGMCNFFKRFFEIFYFSLEVHRNLGDSGCSNVWELMSLLLCSAEDHFSRGLVRGSCPGATPGEGANLLRSKSCSYTFWWVRGTVSSLWAQMFGEEAAERYTGWRGGRKVCSLPGRLRPSSSSQRCPRHTGRWVPSHPQIASPHSQSHCV